MVNHTSYVITVNKKHRSDRCLLCFIRKRLVFSCHFVCSQTFLLFEFNRLVTLALEIQLVFLFSPVNYTSYAIAVNKKHRSHHEKSASLFIDKLDRDFVLSISLHHVCVQRFTSRFVRLSTTVFTDLINKTIFANIAQA